MKSENYILEPLESVWGIKFGSDEISLITQHELARLKDEEIGSVGWRVYGLDESLRVYCAEGKVVSIAVYSVLIYKEKNLIGMDTKDLSSALGAVEIEINETTYCSDGVKEILEVDALGLLVWTRNNHVVSVTCDDGK